MKTSSISNPSCSTRQLSRFLDDEMSEPERQAVENHLNHCPDCRCVLESYRLLGRVARRQADRARVSVDLDSVEDQVLSHINRHRGNTSGWRKWWPPGRFHIPIYAVAAAVACFLIILPFSFQDNGHAPSAIINSFTGSVTSVMFYETPNTHQTIIWFNEESNPSGEPNAGENT
ncbi:MAG: zf-HC2 domain-containing protein [Desulfobacteraceae bacterium]|nr:zf-HC2 domain-containing protein [Desulfobacteraceae bacterium]